LSSAGLQRSKLLSTVVLELSLRSRLFFRLSLGCQFLGTRLRRLLCRSRCLAFGLLGRIDALQNLNRT
jgi:hypothetical protein